MKLQEVKKWVHRRRASIPPALRIDLMRDGARFESFDLTKDAEHEELVSFAQPGDELIAFGEEKRDDETHIVELMRGKVDEQAPARHAGYLPSPEATTANDRTIQVAMREARQEASGLLAQSESMVETQNRLHAMKETAWYEREKELLARIDAANKKLEEEREKSRSNLEAEVKAKQAEFDQKMALAKSENDRIVMHKLLDKAMEIGDGLLDGAQRKKGIIAQFASIWDRLPGSVHEEIAKHLNEKDFAFFVGLLEEADKLEETAKKKRAQKVLGSRK